MKFQVFQPAATLQSIVQCHLEADGRASVDLGEHTLFPNGLSGIFFNFGNTQKIIIHEEYITPPVSIFGQIDRHFTITYQPGFYSLGVLLKPSVLSWLFRIDMEEITNKALDGRLVSLELNALHDQLAEAASVKEKIERIERYLITLAQRSMRPAAHVEHAIHLIQHQKVSSMDQLARTLNVSQRYLEIQFKRTVGLSPKTYSLIHRFKRMEHHLIKMNAIHWENMSFASEYYDQNHFIRDFKRFTGLTPSAYLIESFEMGRSYLRAT